jgi:hypothetical protein
LQHQPADGRAGGGLGEQFTWAKPVLAHGEHPGCHRIDDGLCGVGVAHPVWHDDELAGRAHDALPPGADDVEQHDPGTGRGARDTFTELLDDSDASMPGLAGNGGWRP